MELPLKGLRSSRPQDYELRGAARPFRRSTAKQVGDDLMLDNGNTLFCTNIATHLSTITQQERFMSLYVGDGVRSVMCFSVGADVRSCVGAAVCVFVWQP